jgi:hypothetical protein
MKHEAIYNLYSTVKRIKENTDGLLIAYDINENEVTIDISAVETKATELQAIEVAKENQKATDKANGNQKLLDLGFHKLKQLH